MHPYINAEAARLRGEELRAAAEEARRVPRAPRRGLRISVGRGLIAVGARLAGYPPDPLASGW